MAAPMRSSSQDGSGHRTRVADTRQGIGSTAKPDNTTIHTTTTTNFEYDDNEWDIGIGDLIIDLDADIEKTNEGAGGTVAMATNNANSSSTASSGKAAAAKMAIEHSATVDKGLKMKIKRTKPGTKTSEAKHEIVKSNEQQQQQQQNGTVDGEAGGKGAPLAPPGVAKHPQGGSPAAGKRGSSGHRRDKARDKHEKPAGQKCVVPQTAEVNGVVRVSAPSQQPPPQRPVFPASTGPGPPTPAVATGGPPPPGQPPPSPAAATAQGSAAKPEQAKGTAVQQQVVLQQQQQQPAAATLNADDGGSSPPPPKKFKTEPKDVTDVCVGTSVGTITEPDCLGPCEPGTSVTLEGIVWHETETGVLVVNVTWRGKTYVGTLLDCTRHDWAPPRFCDSPTSDLDTRTPKGRETRSSVHSKLRNGGVKGRRGAANNGSGPSTAPSSPTPFVPPRPEPSAKRKSRVGEEEPSAVAATNGKKAKVAPTPPPVQTGSPPPSPVLLECPEPKCSKKYKHINGLKYHQSHAHGTVAEDEDTKDVTSMSENDESNIEAPSPATPVKSPDKSQDSPLPAPKKEGLGLLDVTSQPGTPRSTPPSPATPQSVPEIVAPAGSPTVPIVENKSVVKPGILRYGATDEFPVGVFGTGKMQAGGITQIQNPAQMPLVRTVAVSISPEPTSQQEPSTQPQSFANQLQAQVNMPSQQFTQPPTLLIPAQNPQNPQSQVPQSMSPHAPASPGQVGKVAQFKVKPAAALMPDDKKDRNKLQNAYKKKKRKSPTDSPDIAQTEQPVFGMEQSGRDEVQSPAYSDISDDGAPVIDGEMQDKTKPADKKTDIGQPLQHMPQYGMYPFYAQSSYLVPNVQDKGKESEKAPVDKPASEKETNKKEGPEYQQKVLQQHYYPYGYVPGYTYNMDPNFGSSVPIVADDKVKEERIKEEPSPIEQNAVKPVAPIPNPIQVPTPNKVKSELGLKEKHQNENHQILKESIEMKSQMNSYIYSRQQQQQQQQAVNRGGEEDMRRFYIYDQRRKEQPPNPEHTKTSSAPNKQPLPQSPSLKHKEKQPPEEKKDKDVKQEGVKPTMETQGPPPPPTSQYAYIHPSYMQSPHYGALPFDPNHPVYRGIMVPGPYSGSPYLHHQIPRYHAPEDLSRAPPPTKALDMLQHHAQYYSSHKIHELQERALKSPTPKTTQASASPSASTGAQVQTPNSGAITTQAGGAPPPGGKQTPGEGKESRSPPPQRHVHTHHHTHVGLGYPMYPAPYGAAVLASQQAAAVTVINPYPPK